MVFLAKTLFKSSSGEIHYGRLADAGFAPAKKEDAEKAVSNLGGKKFWRCRVCGDMHLGAKPPHQCPTCKSIESYAEIGRDKFMARIG